MTAPKTIFKTTAGIKLILAGFAVAFITLFLNHDADAAAQSKSHYLFRTAMTNTGVDLDATGSIYYNLNRQGNRTFQRLSMSVTKLDPLTTYRLIAFTGDSSNSVNVADFTTDRRGFAALTYFKVPNGNKAGRGFPLPNALDPLCNVRELDIVNSTSQTVLRASLDDPDKGFYLISRSMSTTAFLPTATGLLNIKSTAVSTKVSLKATGLNPATTYLLTINGNIVQTNTSDINGKLSITNLPAGFSAVLAIRTLGLNDSTGTNVVLTTSGLGSPTICTVQISLSNQLPITLGEAGNFAVLGAAAVANTGLTTVDGNLGISPGALSSVTGFPPGVVLNGQIFASDNVAQKPTVDQAKLDLTTAYNEAAGRTVAPILVAGNIGGQTLAPGLYKSTSTLEISSGDLTLDAQGDANGVFIFQIASELIVTSDRKVILAGGAQAKNIFWQVGTSATLGTTSVFKGTVMADQSITLMTGATLDGRALVRIAAVTLDGSMVKIPSP